jgi:glycerol kinase
MAGLAAGIWTDIENLPDIKQIDTKFRPSMPGSQRWQYTNSWHHAVRQCVTE